MARTRKAGSQGVPQSKRIVMDFLEPIVLERDQEPPQLDQFDTFPSVVVQNQDDEDVNIVEKHPESPFVLFSYPQVVQIQCSFYILLFLTHYKTFRKMGIHVYGISAEPPEALTSFHRSMNIPFDLLSDPEYKLLGPLGAKKKAGGVIPSQFLVRNGSIVTADYKVVDGKDFMRLLNFTIDFSSDDEDEDDDDDDDDDEDDDDEDDDDDYGDDEEGFKESLDSHNSGNEDVDVKGYEDKGEGAVHKDDKTTGHDKETISEKL